ncbi:hypothetical protein M5C90_24265 [Pseudomonas chlororaphis subsp. piscium]|uniref:hypothetical protein n=1 Tax=Pseudomonas chlororaphis TaxID=587753 RepID=UPI000F55BBF4|nr:hypothetical protein [Pseudomonas chlororaphis]AZD86827.1 hypothetical protein C4K14_4005 [Pseudomonas chlororaphis subsp. aureofaciens]UQS88701.1 hypothetical protein M5C90_24265 [Pseudomonas chlororaphis subsp. piscium]
MTIRNPLFAVGALILSQDIDRLMREGLVDPLPYFTRHARGDWGDVDDDVRQANSSALKEGGQIESLHNPSQDIRIRIYTLADRSITHIELASGT